MNTTERRVIGIYELITGLFGAIFILFGIFTNKHDSFESLMSLMLGVAMFIGVAFAGYAMMNNYKKATRYSILAQGFQVVSVMVGGMFYKFVGGAFISILYKGGEVKFYSTVTAIDYAITKVGTNEFVFQVYLVPLVILLVLLYRHFGK